MKKIFLLGFAVLTIVSCERSAETILHTDEKKEVLTNEDLFKKTSDTTKGGTFNSFDAGIEPGTGTAPEEGLDPKDITPPRR